MGFNDFNPSKNNIPFNKNLNFSMQNHLPMYSFYGDPMNIEGYRLNDNINKNEQNNNVNRLFSP